MQAPFNRFELENFAKMAAHAYLDNNVPLNDTITKLAIEHSLNCHQIDRVSENSNILVNGTLVKKAKEQGTDPRVTFPLASRDEITLMLNEDGVKEANLKKEAEVLELFTVPKAKVNVTKIAEAVCGTIVDDPYKNLPKSVDHVKLAEDFLGGKSIQENIDIASLNLVCQTLEDLENRATIDHASTKMAMDQAECELRDEINDQLLYGLTPATIRDVVKHAQIDSITSNYVDGLITKVAANLQMREGKSSFESSSHVNDNHPLLVKSAAVMSTVNKAVTAGRGLQKIASAHKKALKLYSAAGKN